MSAVTTPYGHRHAQAPRGILLGVASYGNSLRAIPDHHDEKEVASEIGLMYRQLPAAREDKHTHHLDI
ncbi:hypothetical protein VO68_01555 [Aeromonas salmonicida]|nr:hypothetical protein VO68_01555 [Aeromonas salmonicida]RSM31115.1 hypothetical protein C5B76_01615 [Aeromonas salmonicida]